ncbi:MAG: hypothetical protein ACK46Q_01895 [Hyphomonas sp.]
MTYSLRRPLEGLSWLQLLVWPLIFAQLCALKLWVRKYYGRGVPYRIEISRLGAVRLVRLPTDRTSSYAAPGALWIDARAYRSGLVRPEFVLASAPEAAPPAPAPVSIVRLEMDFDRVCVPRLNTS